MQRLSPTDFEGQLEFKRQIKIAFAPLIDFQALMADPEVAQGLMDPQVWLKEQSTSYADPECGGDNTIREI